MKFIQRIQEVTTVDVTAFGGQVIFKVKSLSPLEAEAAGLASSLVASSVLDVNEIKRIAKQKDIFERVESEDATEQDLEQLLNIMHGLDPTKFKHIEDHQNKILKQVVTQASEDQGVTFQEILLVDNAEDESWEDQPPRLWCGHIQKEDRDSIIEVALSAHKEVTKHLQTFQQTG
mgnify:CR=1 FL=1|tara:strand:+ start:5693 stop:6217 length:525 start_codon:yes stop_codon:yes gene_type:complete